MYLKGIEIYGFKSFSKKTYIEFDKGISSIIGPNGSGKSNILDAILWVLGEQSYKNIRAKESNDIIFSGGKNKKPSEYARVTLIIDNKDKYLEIEDEIVEISRMITRQGEGSYYINSNKARLKDIQKLLMDTGIGKQAYSIIGQGRVERIISSSPKDLREIIEEAAGIKRAKYEKEQTLKELENVNTNLEKIEIIEHEISNRIEKLEKESKNAKLFNSYTTKKNDYNHLILKYDEEKLKNILNEKNNEKENLLIEYNKIESEYNENILKKESIDENIKTNLLNKTNNKIKLENLKINIDKFKIEIFDLNKKINEYNADIKSMESINSEIEKSNEKINEEIILKEKELKELENKYQDKKIELAQKNEVYVKLITKIEENEKNIKEYDKEKNEVELDILKLKYSIESEKPRYDKSIEQISNSEKELNDEKEILKKVEEEYKDKENELLILENEKEEKEKKKKILTKKYEDNTREYNNLSQKIIECSKKKEILSEKYKNLKNIVDNNLSMGSGVKYISKKYKDDEKFMGIVVNLIKFDKKYNIAISSIASSYLQDIVVKDSFFATNLIKELKENKIGTCNFLPLNNIQKINKFGKFTFPNMIGYARNLVECDDNVRDVIDSIFNNAIIVEDIESANKLKEEFNKKNANFYDRIVTLDGDIITSRGRMIGGYKSSKINNLLEQKTNLEELKLELEVAIEEYENIEIELSNVYEENKSDNKKLEILSQEIREISYKIDDVNNGINIINERKTRINKNISTITYELNDFINTKNTLEISIKDSYAKIDENTNKLDDISKKIQEVENILLELKLNQEDVEVINTLNTEIAIISEKIENTNRYILNQSNKLKMNSTNIFDNKETLDDLKQKKSNLDKEHEEKNKMYTISEKEYSFLTEEFNKQDKDIEEYNNLYKQINTKILELNNLKHNLSTKLDKVDNIIDKNTKEYYKVTEEYNSEYVLNEMLEEITNEETYEMYLNIKKGIEKSILSLGDVNLSTINEFEEESKRYEDILDKKSDIETSKHKIQMHIKELDTDMSEKFLIAYNEISQNFKKVCYKLLNKSSGKLKLLDEEDVLNSGIELSVKYKHKLYQSLELLSGGEKSMLAVAFILSIFMYKPSPFTFFDEIEAALDEANTKMLVNILRDFVDKSQFILITHNKETMRNSDKLYGVTMNKEIGESIVMSVKTDFIDTLDD